MRKEGIYYSDGRIYGYELLNGKPNTIVEDFLFFKELAKKVPDNDYVYHINLYPRTLLNNGRKIKKILQEKRNLAIEIIEYNSSIDVQNLSNVIREANAKIVLDDFGKCGSNFDRIFLPNLQAIKIDRDMWKNKNFRTFLEHLIKAIKDINVKTIAEKVETKEEFELCKSLGFDLFQGYYFKR